MRRAWLLLLVAPLLMAATTKVPTDLTILVSGYPGDSNTLTDYGKASGWNRYYTAPAYAGLSPGTTGALRCIPYVTLATGSTLPASAIAWDGAATPPKVNIRAKYWRMVALEGPIKFRIYGPGQDSTIVHRIDADSDSVSADSNNMRTDSLKVWCTDGTTGKFKIYGW